MTTMDDEISKSFCVLESVQIIRRIMHMYKIYEYFPGTMEKLLDYTQSK